MEKAEGDALTATLPVEKGAAMSLETDLAELSIEAETGWVARTGGAQLVEGLLAVCGDEEARDLVALCQGCYLSLPGKREQVREQ